MAKTRVYELARDLNLTNQILLSKLNELDISVKSHMSSLDDEAVAKVKTVIFGKKEVSIEETRVKPTVIRRRKKKVPLEVVTEHTADSVEAAAEHVLILAEEQTTGDAQATVPDRRDLTPVVAEPVVVGDDVIEPCTDHPGEHGPDRDRAGVVAGSDVALLEPSAEQPHGGDHAEVDQHQCRVLVPARPLGPQQHEGKTLVGRQHQQGECEKPGEYDIDDGTGQVLVAGPDGSVGVLDVDTATDGCAQSASAQSATAPPSGTP